MKVQWTNKALSDLKRVYEFLVSVNKPAAIKVVRSLPRSDG
jgi:plasmid stabilization system protein ParE